MALLEVKNVVFDYFDGLHERDPLLSNISFEVTSGTMLHVTGINGSGKSTLLKLLAGIYLPHSGEIRFNDQRINSQLAQYQMQLAYVGHRSGFSNGLTVMENCLYDLKCDTTPTLILEWLERFQLLSKKNQQCGLLSAGQRRRLSLLRLFLSKTMLWIIDEPLVGLDTQSMFSFLDAVEYHLQKGGMVIFTSHQSLERNILGYMEYRLC